MKYENYGLIQENWDRFVVNPVSLEESFTTHLDEMFDTNVVEAIPGATIRNRPRGIIDKMMKKFKDKAAKYSPWVALFDFVTDLPQTGLDLDVFLHSPLSTAMITYSLMRTYKISKEQAVKQIKDQGPDAVRQAAQKGGEVAAASWKATVKHIERSANDPRAPDTLKDILNGLSALINPQDPSDLQDLENEPAMQRRVKQIVDKTAGQVKPQQQSDDEVIDAEFEEEPT
jgi:hypothetical protein